MKTACKSAIGHFFLNTYVLTWTNALWPDWLLLDSPGISLERDYLRSNRCLHGAYVNSLTLQTLLFSYCCYMLEKTGSWKRRNLRCSHHDFFFDFSGSCTDQNRLCGFWAGRQECRRNPRFMLIYCKRSCRVCWSHKIIFIWREYLLPGPGCSKSVTVL